MASKDPYKIPLKTAQDWIKNWLNYTPSADDATASPTSEMRGFIVRKDDLTDLMREAPDAEFVRFYIGLHKDEKGKNIPHLLSVNAKAVPDPKHPGLFFIKDMINQSPAGAMVSGEEDVNDVTHPVPPYDDPTSPLNNP
jgi:hypothetical protein